MHQHPHRRVFLVQLVALGCAGPLQAQTRTAQPVDEAGEQAVALGYRHDTSRIDGKKYPQHSTAQRCSNCSFWQGKPDDGWAGCAMFGRKHVANTGWCLAWAKTPG